MKNEDEWEEEEDWEVWEEEEDWDCPLGYDLNCDPSCPHWMGDGLCELVINEMAEADEEYRKKHYKKEVECKICHKKLEYYELHAKEPWTFNPMLDGPATIGLEIYGPIFCKKKILHSYYDDDNCEVLHISVEGKEKLVKLLHSHPSE